jgi:hypothetical protein
MNQRDILEQMLKNYRLAVRLVNTETMEARIENILTQVEGTAASGGSATGSGSLHVTPWPAQSPAQHGRFS